MQSNNKTKTRSLNKKEIFFVLAFSLLFVYCFFLFKQIDFIKNNQVEFGILFEEIIGAYILYVASIFVILSGILLTLCYFAKPVYKYVVLVLFGFELACYTQILFFNNSKITNVNGYVSANVFTYILNAFLFLVIWMLPLIIYLIYNHQTKKAKQPKPEQKQTDNKNQEQAKPSLYKTVMLVMAVIFSMQLVGWFTTMNKYGKVPKENNLYYFSMDEQLKLSKNNNIVTFVLDRMDTDYVNEIFEKYPDDKEIFSGFTYYTDNISQYPGTFPSVVGLLSGETFDKQQSQTEFSEKAWENPVLFEALKANNYKVNGLLNSIATFYEFSQIEDKFDNIKKLDAKNREIKKFRFCTSVTSAAMNQFMPYCLKRLFAGYLSIPNECVKIKNTPDYFDKTVSPSSDLAFYNRLKDVGLSADEEQSVYSFVHLLASHNPYGYNENLKVTQNSNSIKQTRGTFKILEEYFNQMKTLGIYQSSTIIVMADHGHWSTTENLNTINDTPMAALFIKQAGEGTNLVNDSSTPLKTNDEAQLYHANYMPTIIEILYNNDNLTNQTYFDTIKASKKSYFDVINGDGTQTREYYYVRWTNMNSTFYKAKYIITGNANDKRNWTKASA